MPNQSHHHPDGERINGDRTTRCPDPLHLGDVPPDLAGSPFVAFLAELAGVKGDAATQLDAIPDRPIHYHAEWSAVDGGHHLHLRLCANTLFCLSTRPAPPVELVEHLQTRDDAADMLAKVTAQIDQAMAHVHGPRLRSIGEALAVAAAELFVDADVYSPAEMMEIVGSGVDTGPNSPTGAGGYL